MIYSLDFFIRHTKLRESADKVLFIDLEQDIFICDRDIDLYYPELFNFSKFKHVKLLRSKSKQSRVVAVVCK